MDTFITFLSDHWLLFCGVFTSILLAAFFAASETAMLFANKTKLRQLADAGNARAEAALNLALERDRLHSALLLVENFFLVLAVVLSTVIALYLFGDALAAIAATVLVMSVVVVLFAKLAPKGLAARDPDRLALVVAYPMQFVMKLVSPVSRVVEARPKPNRTSTPR